MFFGLAFAPFVFIFPHVMVVVGRDKRLPHFREVYSQAEARRSMVVAFLGGLYFAAIVGAWIAYSSCARPLEAVAKTKTLRFHAEPRQYDEHVLCFFRLIPAIQVVYRFGVELTECDFRELTPDRYEAYRRNVGPTSERIYRIVLVCAVGDRLDTPEKVTYELEIVTEREKLLIVEAVHPVEDKFMTTAFHAIYENGVFRPIQPVGIPDRCEVEVEIRTITTVAGGEGQETFPEETITVLSARDRDRFLELIENPPPPNEALRNAVADYRKHYG